MYPGGGGSRRLLVGFLVLVRVAICHSCGCEGRQRVSTGKAASGGVSFSRMGRRPWLKWAFGVITWGPVINLNDVRMEVGEGGGWGSPVGVLCRTLIY
ncbi:hypothetical protein L873DRAFT_474613 [Choiromyces venosus 120613-1]|uniref:Secreted protein n=1 Tax=Choiromyces venosus 120613-1 TaxID=1336337 RepID=A0A3N4IWK0_9PEZI|nr:hypothetical protein L873DRAFT_474613 [Choiromyces venosus 120613-1]